MVPWTAVAMGPRGAGWGFAVAESTTIPQTGSGDWPGALGTAPPWGTSGLAAAGVQQGASKVAGFNGNLGSYT